MYLMYVDESGDCGLTGPSGYYSLCGIVVHELRWRPYLDQLIDFRRRMKTQYGLGIRDEIHSGPFIHDMAYLPGLSKHDKLSILRHFTNELAGMSDLSVIPILIDKSTKTAGYDVFEWAWKLLIQRFENAITARNLNGPMNADERGILLPDKTSEVKLTKLLRKIRRYNPIPHKGRSGTYNQPVQMIVEDPCFRDSKASYFIQAADLAAYLLYQKQKPCKYIKKTGAAKYFDRLNPILYVHGCANDPQGIVRM